MINCREIYGEKNFDQDTGRAEFFKNKEAQYNKTQRLLLEKVKEFSCHTAIAYSFQSEEQLTEILEKSKLVKPENHVSLGMENGACYDNALHVAIHYGKTVGLKIGIGLALGIDGVWRPHAWITKGDEIHETTSNPFDYYFGFSIDTPEEFCKFMND